MKVALSGNLNYCGKILRFADILEKEGHKVFIPKTAEMIRDGKTTQEFITNSKRTDNYEKFSKENNSLRIHLNKIMNADCSVILNFEKNNILGYVGGSLLIEMGVAFALKKKLFLLNPIPNLPCADEIKLMNPIILNGDLSLVK